MPRPIRARVHSLVSLVFFCAVAMLAGCEKKQEPTTAPGADAPRRVVSLAPAITQMMVDVGRSGLLVGVSEHDAAAPASLPVVGNYQDINTEALLASRPTHVLMMTGKGGAPARLKELAAAGKFVLVAYPYPSTTSDVLSILAGVPAGEQPWLGRVLGCEPEATAAASAMTRRLLGLRELTKKQGRRPRTLIVIGLGPVMASGNNTVLNELLLAAGGDNVASGERVSAPTFDRESLRALSPDVIVMVMPDAPPLEPMDQDARLAEFRGLDVPAVRDGRVTLIRDPLALLPATNVSRVGAQIAKALWPGLEREIDEAMRAGASATQPAAAGEAGH